MATIGKRKTPRKNPLGTPPTVEQARDNLNEPETAPAIDTSVNVAPVVKKVTPKNPKKGGAATGTKRTEQRVDGRSLRKTGRTEQFATRVSPDFKKELYSVAQMTGKNYNVILEESLELYKQKELAGA